MSATAAVPVHSESVGKRNRNLQWLRAAAALFVLLYHASSHLAIMRGYTGFSDVFGHEFGLVGVAIFFAISGALMADIARKTAAPEFLIHRLIRIYPLFLLVFAVLPWMVYGDFSFRFQVAWLAPIGNYDRHRLGVEWTLIFELFFYVLLFLALAAGLRRHLELLAVGWLAVLAVAAFTASVGFQTELRPDIHLMALYAANVAFAGGLLIPYLARRNVFQPALAALAAALAIVPMAFDIGVARFVGGIAAVLFVGLAVAPHVDPAAKDGLFGTIVTKLGDWSYALYLCHVPIQVAIYENLQAPPAILWTLAIAVPLLASVPLGILDLKVYRRLRARSAGLRPEQARRWAWAYVAAYVLIAVWFTYVDR